MRVKTEEVEKEKHKQFYRHTNRCFVKITANYTEQSEIPAHREHQQHPEYQHSACRQSEMWTTLEFCVAHARIAKWWEAKKGEKKSPFQKKLHYFVMSLCAALIQCVRVYRTSVHPPALFAFFVCNKIFHFRNEVVKKTYTAREKMLFVLFFVVGPSNHYRSITCSVAICSTRTHNNRV